MLLRALVESPELRLRVLAGEEALDRPVDGVFTTDLLDPRRYLSGGEIVLTGLMWRRTPADSRGLCRLRWRAPGWPRWPPGTPRSGRSRTTWSRHAALTGCRCSRCRSTCRSRSSPNGCLRAFLPAGPGPAVARLRLLAAAEPGTPAAAAGNRPTAMAALFAAADAEYGVAGWVLSAAGRLVAGTRPAAPTPGCGAALARAWLGGPGLPATVTVDGAPFSLFGVPGPSSHRLACWFVGLAGDQAAWDDERRAVAAELAGLVAGYRARYEEAQRAVRRPADAALHRVLEWQSGRAGRAMPPSAGSAEIAIALRRCGLAPEGSVVAVAVTAPRTGDLPSTGSPAMTRPGAGPHEAVRPGWRKRGWRSRGRRSGETYQDAAQEAARACWRRSAGRAGRRERDGSVALVHPPAASWAGSGGDRAAGGMSGARARAADRRSGGAGRPQPGLRGRACWPARRRGADAGAAARPRHGRRPGRAGRSPGSPALAQARQARRLAALLGAGVRLVDAAELGSCELLLAMAPAEARRAFRASLLTPLLDYDRDHGTELVRTLRVFLDCSGSWTKAAEAMFVHVNSLRYRIRRVEELTGRDLRSLDDQAALLLALQIRD